MTAPNVVIIGAGHAGVAVAAQLREQGHAGPIRLVGDETTLPYQRPPLSKAWLKGEADASALHLRAQAWYAAQGIELLRGARATGIDREARRVLLADGAALPYDVLVLAMGARARPLAVPGATLGRVLSLRGMDDAAALQAALAPGSTLAIVGGGYIGLEVAASARALGLEVCVLEREQRLLARVASAPLAAFFEDLHRNNGVRIVREARLAQFEGNPDVTALAMEDGSRLACQAALVGVGAQPRDELARAAGLACENGIVVDEQARTSDPAIFAIGDLSWRPLPVYDGRRCRLESVPNALEQARQAACAIAAKPQPAPEVPWFWSDQYDAKLQIAGLPFDADRHVLRGDPQTGKFAIWHLAGERVMSVEAVNSPLDFIAAKQLIASGAPVCATRLADPACKAKEAVLGTA